MTKGVPIFGALIYSLLFVLYPTYGEETYFEKNGGTQNIHMTKPISGPLCGHACLKLALDLLGIKVTIEELEREIPHHDKGASVRDLVKAARAHGVGATWFKQKANINELFENDNDLLIIRINKNVDGEQLKHYVLLIKRYYGRFLLIDPFDRTYIYDEQSVRDIYVGDGLRITKDMNIMPTWKEMIFASGSGYLVALTIGTIWVRLQKR